jgi:hypothetical protein
VAHRELPVLAVSISKPACVLPHEVFGEVSSSWCICMQCTVAAIHSDVHQALCANMHARVVALTVNWQVAALRCCAYAC